MTYEEIFNGIRKGILIQKENLPPEVVLKIQEAAKKTVFLPTDLERFFDYF